MATIKELREQIQSVNALGRAQLSNAGVDIPETATTYDIMQNVGLPDWDDDSPIIASGYGYAGYTCAIWEVTEKGTMRWKYDPNGTGAGANNFLAGWGAGTNATLSPKEYLEVCNKIRQVYVPDDFKGIIINFLTHCERMRLPQNLQSQIIRYSGLTEIEENTSPSGDFDCIVNHSLEKIILSENRTTLKSSFAQSCYLLKEVVNIENITTFGNTCFSDCNSLSGEIVFSPDLISIGSQSFNRAGITGLVFQTPTGNPPTIASNAFQNCTAITKLSVYEGWNLTINVSWSTNLTQESLHKMIENLADLTEQTYQTFQVGSTNIAKIDEEHIAMLNTKNWNYI